MRIWDVSPGYLSRGSLLGEHREIHAIHSILTKNKKGYSRHPETLRWKDRLEALSLRHKMIAAELALRGYRHESPIAWPNDQVKWPDVYITAPDAQYELLGGKYAGRDSGPIPLPLNAQELWRHHKFSVLARDEKRYRELGAIVAGGKKGLFTELSIELVELLRREPKKGGFANALDHMWGFVKKLNPEKRISTAGVNSATGYRTKLKFIREAARTHGVKYLLESTALYELESWLSPEPLQDQSRGAAAKSAEVK